MTEHPDLYPETLTCLRERDPDRKLTCVRALRGAWMRGELGTDGEDIPVAIEEPGRPERPVLVPPREVERRSAHTVEGRAALIHALVHIEFNAINLALDAVYRFRDMPREFYDDWLRIAEEEAYHFELLREHLRTLGHDYGSFAAHNGLWEMAVKTAGDPLARMAVVPKTLEARGLDVNPALVRKLAAAGDARGVDVLEIILRDEITHVAAGNRWFAYLCAVKGLEPLATFRQLMRDYSAPRPRGPFHVSARRAAGFSDEELRMFADIAAAQD